jgi:S-DNA-T family DNA segregation ATPase FtsK/SpoIIIE
VTIEHNDTAPQTANGNGRPAAAFSDISRPLIPHQGSKVLPFPERPGTMADLVNDVAVPDLGTPPPPDEDDEEFGPILPPWLRDGNAFKGTAWKVWRRTKYKAGFHSFRLPLYAIRWSRRAIVGLGRSIATGWVWAFDLEGRPLRKAAVDALDGSEYLRLRIQHHHRVKLRLWAALGTSLTSAIGLAIAENYSHATMPGAALAAMVTFGIVGKPEDAAPILDSAITPLTVELTPDHLNDAFRAAGLLGKEASLVTVQPIMRDSMDIGWTCVVDLPKGGGKKAADVVAARDTLAAELGIDEVQLMVWRIRAGEGGHAARLGMWVADDDPYIGGKTPSPLLDLDSFDIWSPIPFGRNARGKLITLMLMWESIFFGGLPRRGKTFAQRLAAAAGALDPYARIYCADGKGGRDWKAVSRIAHRYITGAESDALKAFMGMLAELIGEMERRFQVINGLSDDVCPEGKLTPQIAKKYNMPPILVIIDELQEYFSSLDKTDYETALEMMCRLARRGPAAGFIMDLASQRPDADSVPTKLREIISLRFSVQCVDKASSDMVLGKGKAAIGADASLLSAEHKGVGVLVTGPAEFDTVRTDYLDLPAFSVICEKGRALRREAGTLSGDAAGKLADLAAPQQVIPAILTDCLTVMRHAATMHTVDLLEGLATLDDDAWGDLNPDALASKLEAAGVVRSSKQVRAGADKVNLAGYRRADLEAAMPASWSPEQTA